MDLDTPHHVAQADIHPVVQLAFVTQHRKTHVAPGTFGEPVLTEPEQEPEPVLLDLHVLPLNQSLAQFGTAQQRQT